MSRMIVPQIPHEIAIDILARLPAKPLLRLKFVCKSWLSLISNDPQFAKLHLHFAKHDTSVNRYRIFLSIFPFRSIDLDAFCYANNLMTREISFPISGVQPTKFSVFGSCNGLIAAFWHAERLCDDLNPAMQIIVWNPTTGDFREFPDLDSSAHGDIGEIFYGFGYDSNLDDYKIVMGTVSASASGSIIKMDVLYLKAREWRSSQDVHIDFELEWLYYSSTGGFVHWLLDLRKDPDGKLGILSFDVGEEKFLEMMPVPDDITKRLSNLTVEGIGDNVWLCNDPQWPAEFFEGWMIKRDGKEISWRKLYSFRCYTLGIRYEKFIEVIWVAKNGNVVLDVDFTKLVLYNPQEQSSLEIGVYPIEYRTSTYMETLVSPNAT